MRDEKGALKMVEKFEDLIAWQKARVLSKLIYQVTRVGEFARDFGLAKQIQRAAVSIMANITEGFERGGRGEFHHFLSTAKASCAEVRSHLYVALDVGYLDQSQFQELMTLAVEVGRIIGGLRMAVQRQRNEPKEKKE
jgi:four helix bundle protein